MNVGSLFSGIGGIDLGLERAGMRVAWQCELDPWCRGILARHWPDVPCYGDVRSIGSDAPKVDVLAGGFPCQPVSLAGKGLAQADDRWLWPEFARLVRVLRPRYVIAENVPGLLARGLDIVLADLAALGFDAEWTVFGARDVGAPHRRDRVWIVAWDRRGTDSDRVECEGDPPAQRRSTTPELHPGSDGLRDDVADADRWRRNGSWQFVPEAGWVEPTDSHSAVADSDGAGRQGRERPELPARGWGQPAGRCWWEVEPPLGRVADGISGRVAQLRGLGNAVVPACAEHIGRLVMQLTTEATP